MSDDLERRLEAAGARWRAEQQPPAPWAAPDRHRARWLPAAAAAAVVMVVLAATVLTRGAGPDPRPLPRASSTGSWEQMASSPLSPRLRPLVVGGDDAVVVLGGRDDRPCPANASCVLGPEPTLRDGAVYDLPSQTWRPIAPAPLPLDVTSSAVLDGVLYLWLPRLALRAGDPPDAPPSVLAYDLRADTWSELPEPPVVGSYLRLVATDDRLVAYYGEVGRADAVDLAYDPATGRWERLPVAPYAPTFDRTIVWDGQALVLITAAAAPASQDEQQGPPFLRAAVLDGPAWRELPSQTTVIGGSTDWSWTGSRVVSASTATFDGGQNSFGRPYPIGGFLVPSTGRWSELPTPPDHTRTALPAAAEGRYVANGQGLVLDTQAPRWLEPGPQPAAADQDAGAAWAGGRLLVWGGAAGVEPAGPNPPTQQSRLLASGAVWTPPAN